MSELSLSFKALWQAPLGWLGVSFLCGLCLMGLFQQIPSSYHRPLRNARWIIIPYLGMVTGGISPRLLGLTGINWSASFGFGLVLIGSVLVVIIIVRSVMAFSLAAAPTTALPATPVHLAQPTTHNYLHNSYTTGLPIAFLTSGAEEFHLAFLRSASWELLLAWPLFTVQANYWAAWIALVLALPEALHYQTTVTQRLCKGALLVTTTVLFIFTRNLWLSWLLHLLGWTLLAPAAGRDNPA